MSTAMMMNYDEKQVVFSQGIKDPYLYKILSGKIGIYVNYGRENEKLLGITNAPDYIGALNALAGSPSVYTAVAMTKTMLLKLPEAELNTFVKNDPGSAVALMRAMAKKLIEDSEELSLLLGELREVGKAPRPEGKAVRELAQRYDTLSEDNLILDRYEEHVPEPEQPPEAEIITASLDVVQQGSDLYLADHKGYPGVFHPEYKEYLIEVDYVCPHCQNKFRAPKILTSRLIPIRNEAEEARFDLRVTYRGFEAEWYEIVTCPHCYFSSFENYFRDNKSIYRSRYETKLAQFCDSVHMDCTGERDLDFVFAQHYLALLCAPGFTDWRQITARVWMNLIRLYQDAGEEQLAKEAEKKTVEAYQTVYMECHLQPGQEQRLCLTVAGMLYAQGEKKEARVWASKVRTAPGDRSAYWNMAEQLMHDVRAELEEEQGK